MFLTSISRICRRGRVEDSVDLTLILWILISTFTIIGLFVDDTRFCDGLVPRFLCSVGRGITLFGGVWDGWVVHRRYCLAGTDFL